MIGPAASSVATAALHASLEGTAWVELWPIMSLAVYFILLVVALLHPVSRAYLICSFSLLRGSWLDRSMYAETSKKPGQWFSRTTCIAIIGKNGAFEKIYYGKPELMDLMNKGKKNV